jgi:hypothetical protein
MYWPKVKPRIYVLPKVVYIKTLFYKHINVAVYSGDKRKESKFYNNKKKLFQLEIVTLIWLEKSFTCIKL